MRARSTTRGEGTPAAGSEERVRAPASLRSIDLQWAAGIFVAATSLRLLFLWWVHPDPTVHVLDDTWFYHHAARALVEGRGYIFPGRSDAPTAYWPPGYPALLSSVYLLPGPDLIAGRVLNAVVGGAGCAMLFGVGRLLAGRTVGVAAAGMLALFPSDVFGSSLLFSAPAYDTLLVAVLLLFAWGLTRRPCAATLWLGLAIGVSLGIASLFRGEAVLLPLVFGVVWWVHTMSLKQTATFVAAAFVGIAIVLTGWTARNAIQLDAPIPINTGSSVVLSLGHWSGADGGGDRQHSREVLLYYGDRPYPEREVKGAQKRTREAFTYMATHPLRELSLIPRRLFELYRHDRTGVDWIAHDPGAASPGTLNVLRGVADAAYYLLLCAALVGAFAWWRINREAAVLLIGTVLYTSALIGVFFFGDPRYHSVLVPVFCLLAAPALISGWESMVGFLDSRRHFPRVRK